MEKRCHSRMMLGQFWLSMRTSFVAVTKPARRVARLLQLFDRVFDGLAADQQGRTHLGSHRARRVELCGRAAEDERAADQADQTKPQ